MAIIYTYPRLTNPDGTELIVVSETKNQNATRLLSVADICNFCSGPGMVGCTNSFLTITTPSIIPAIALGCDDNLTFTSGDGSVTISNVGNTINFTAAGGGGSGGCPPTYVVKPVICEDTECRISTKIFEWVWTCDETLGALAPGYINDFTLNGVVLPHPDDGESECWYIELATLSAGATTCEACCTPLETAYKLAPCSLATTYYTTATLTPGIAALVGLVSLITTPEGELCYTVSEESGDPPISVILGLVQDDCESPECTPPIIENLLLTPCPENSVGYQDIIVTNTTQSPTLVGAVPLDHVSVVTTDPETLRACYVISITANPIGIIVVEVDNFFTEDPTCDCCLWEFREYEECFTGTSWTFSINDYPVLVNNPSCIKIVPTGLGADPLCLIFNQCIEDATPVPVLTLVDNTAYCCEDVDCPSTARYEKCPDAPLSYEQYIYIPLPTGLTSVILATGDLDPGPPGDETWCYGLVDNVEGPPFIGTTADYCPPLGHCFCPETCEVMEYYDCNNPGIPLYTTNMSIPPIGFIWGIAEDSNCYKTNGPVPPNGSLVNITTVDAVWMDDAEDCGCCDTGLNPFTYAYNICTEYDPPPVGAPLSIFVDITGFPGYLSGAHPDVISVDVGIGYDVCYEFVTGACDIATHTIVDNFEDCPTCISSSDPVWELLSCVGAITEYVTQSDFAPDPSALNVGDIINTTTGTLSSISTCWEIIDKNSPDPVTQFGTQDWNGPIAAGVDPPFYTACQCCEMDLRTYDVCDTGTTCQGLVTPQLIIDMTAFGGTPPAAIVANDDASGLDCCYILNPEIPPCMATTGVYVSTVDDCDDPSCPA